jgi:hypothetical protein
MLDTPADDPGPYIAAGDELHHECRLRAETLLGAHCAATYARSPARVISEP